MLIFRVVDYCDFEVPIRIVPEQEEEDVTLLITVTRAAMLELIARLGNASEYLRTVEISSESDEDLRYHPDQLEQETPREVDEEPDRANGAA